MLPVMRPCFALALLLLSATLPLFAQPVGDGVADDTAAVQQRLDAGGAVRFGHPRARNMYKWTYDARR